MPRHQLANLNFANRVEQRLVVTQSSAQNAELRKNNVENVLGL